MTKSEIMERFGDRVSVRPVDRVASGEPCRLRLTWRKGANTVAAALALVRRHLSLQDAHRAMTVLVEERMVTVEVPMVEDLERLMAELTAVGVDTVEA